MLPLPSQTLTNVESQNQPLAAQTTMAEAFVILRSVVDSLPQAMYWKDTNAVFLGCNQAFAQEVGLDSPDEIVGKTDQDLLTQSLQETWLTDRDRTVIAQNTAECHTVEYSEQGQVTQTRLTIRKIPFSDPQGALLGLVSTLDQIHHSPQTEQTPKISESELQGFFAAITDVVLIRDEHGRCLSVAPTNPVNLVKAPQEMVGKTLSEVMPQPQAEFILHHIQQALATQQVVTCEYSLVANGRDIWLSARMVPIAANRVILAAQDITPYRLAEAALRQSESKNRAMLSALPDLIMRMTGDGIYLDFSPTETFRVFGSSELVGQGIYGSLPDDLARLRMEYIQQALQTETMQIYEQEILVDQQIRTEEVRIVVSGKNEVLIIVRDISDRHRAEQALEQLNAELEARIADRTDALQKSEARLRRVLQNMPVMMNAFDTEHNIIMWNSECERVTGYSAAEVIRNPNAMELVYPDANYRQTMLAEWARLGNNFRNWEWQVWCKDGSIKTVLWSNLSEEFPIPGWAYWGVGIDISDRKQIEHAFQESQQLLQLVMDNIPQAIFWKDRQSVYLGCNRRYAQDAGLATPDAILGKTDYDLWKPEEATQFRAFDQRVMNSDTPVLHLVEPLPEINGEIGWLEINKIPLHTDNGQVVGVLGTYEDITERKKAEAILCQFRDKAEELEQTLKELKRTQSRMIQSEKMSSLGQLVAGVAHEINNPVNFIYGNLTYAHHHTQDLLNLLRIYQKHYPQPVLEVQTTAEEIDLEFLVEDLPKILHSMQVGADRIKNIVLSLRNFSRMDEAEMKAVDIHEGIDSTLMILQSRLKAQPKRSEIKVIQDYGELPLVECYAGQLNQVFMNLFTNAIDALEDDPSHPNPQIRIRTAIRAGDRVMIGIADNGPGIPKSVQQQMFDPFFTTKPIGQGTGMGLSISYQIVVEKHGGSLDCSSSPGVGTEFRIEIPVGQSTP